MSISLLAAIEVERVNDYSTVNVGLSKKILQNIGGFLQPDLNLYSSETYQNALSVIRLENRQYFCR